MTSYVPVELRRQVESRAEQICEYCLIHESDTFLGCQVDHIIAEKHGGLTTADNLCLACTFCNRSKGSDVGSIDLESGELTRFFRPRLDTWTSHFSLQDDAIHGVTSIGEVTARILGFNDRDRRLERRMLIEIGAFPSPAALRILSRREA